ncbi:armadillo-type protein [Syncephalis plumigaleata]|nr:armadillo-type protein [Syncephalis plumigaleata]
MSEISPLTPNTLRGLQDKVYERRKAAALEVEKLIRQLVEVKDYERIMFVIRCLTDDYTLSLLPNVRNGGAIGLAAVAIGLGTEVNNYLSVLIPSITPLFTAEDSTVRYGACEAMYNIANAAKAGILRFFTEIFDGLSKLVADPDKQVAKGANHLNMLIKNIVAEHTSVHMPATNELDDYPITVGQGAPHSPITASSFLRPFTLTKFIPVLAERMHITNEHVRMFLVQWLTVLNSVPDLELVYYLPAFLNELIKFLSDRNQEIRNATALLLADFLQEIRDIAILRNEQQAKTTEIGGVESNGTTDDVNHSTLNERDNNNPMAGVWTPGQGIEIDYTQIIKILQPHLISTDEEIQLTAIRWLNEFMHIAQSVVVPFTPELLRAILPSLSHQRSDIREIATRANRNLFKLIQHIEIPPQTKHDSINSRTGIGNMSTAASDDGTNLTTGSEAETTDGFQDTTEASMTVSSSETVIRTTLDEKIDDLYFK